MEVRAALNTHSAISLVENQAYHGDEECQDVRVSRRQMIALTKAQVRGEATPQMPTFRSSLIVGRGEGRATREFELIWWPDLYSRVPNCGKIEFRYYVAKRTVML